MRKAAEFVKSSDDILILTHKNPDGDAIGSVLGLATALAGMDKNVASFLKEEAPKTFSFLPNFSTIRSIAKPKYYDLIILLDCATFLRTGIVDIKDVAETFGQLLIIDHHPKGETECDRFANCHYIINSKTSSTAVLVYEFLKELNIRINKDIANCLLTGIFTDTGGFQHDNTDSQTLRIAAELMKKGSRVDKIARNIFGSKNIAALKLWGRAFDRVQTDEKSGMAVSYVSKKDIEEFNVKQDDLSGLVSIINTISDAKFSLLLTEYEDKKIRGSLRSEEYKGIDVSRIARSLGGGGHKLASGFEMDGDIKDSISKIKEMIIKSKQEL